MKIVLGDEISIEKNDSTGKAGGTSIAFAPNIIRCYLRNQ